MNTCKKIIAKDARQYDDSKTKLSLYRIAAITFDLL
jgi:hypothetical protein